MAALQTATASGAIGMDLPPYLSNGVVGLRCRETPSSPGVCIVNGVVGLDPERKIEAAAYAPFPLFLDASVDGDRLRDCPAALEAMEQRYDFQTGELTSEFVAVLGGARLPFSTTTFCSRSHPHIVVQETTIKANCAAPLRVSCGIFLGEEVRGAVVDRFVDVPGAESNIHDGTIRWVTDGALASCGMATWSTANGERGKKDAANDKQGPLLTHFDLSARSDRAVVVRQMTAIVGSLVHGRPHEEATRRLAEAIRIGPEKLRQLNRDAWAGLWRARPVVEGMSESNQDIVDAGFYYLNSSVHLASPSATSIFGLAQWPDYHYYYGHVMWDIDAFCVPVLALTQPEAARAILEFRLRGVDAARRNARSYGFSGLRYPWEAGALTGEEVSPERGEGATHAIHVSLHVARAFCLFALSSADRRFLAEHAWPVIEGVADFICDRLTWIKGKPHILGATGPAEIPNPPDDDTFTIVAALDLLERAAHLAGWVGADVPQSWRVALGKLGPPRRSDGALAGHADFRIDEQKGATPSALAAFFPYHYPASTGTRRATLDLFLSHWEDYVGSPMLASFYPVWACYLGNRELAARLFEEGYAQYDAGRFHQCLEYRADHPDCKTRAGPFFANIGGMLFSLYQGFPRLQISSSDPQSWAREEIVLPRGWKSIQVERLWIGGQPWSLEARHGRKAQLTPAS